MKFLASIYKQHLFLLGAACLSFLPVLSYASKCGDGHGTLLTVCINSANSCVDDTSSSQFSPHVDLFKLGAVGNNCFQYCGISRLGVLPEGKSKAIHINPLTINCGDTYNKLNIKIDRNVGGKAPVSTNIDRPNKGGVSAPTTTWRYSAKTADYPAPILHITPVLNNGIIWGYNGNIAAKNGVGTADVATVTKPGLQLNYSCLFLDEKGKQITGSTCNINSIGQKKLSFTYSFEHDAHQQVWLKLWAYPVNSPLPFDKSKAQSVAVRLESIQDMQAKITKTQVTLDSVGFIKELITVLVPDHNLQQNYVAYLHASNGVYVPCQPIASSSGYVFSCHFDGIDYNRGRVGLPQYIYFVRNSKDYSTHLMLDEDQGNRI